MNVPDRPEDLFAKSAHDETPGQEIVDEKFDRRGHELAVAAATLGCAHLLQWLKEDGLIPQDASESDADGMRVEMSSAYTACVTLGLGQATAQVLRSVAATGQAGAPEDRGLDTEEIGMADIAAHLTAQLINELLSAAKSGLRERKRVLGR